MALGDEILALIQKRPGITDAEIARMIPGPKSRHQQVNARCRRLEEEGVIQRIKPSVGAIGNHPLSSSNRTEGSPWQPAREKPLPGGRDGSRTTTSPSKEARAVTPTRLSLEFHWQSVGEITLREQLLSFPLLPERAGIYRIRLPVSRSVYVGETNNLRRRMQNYRTPGASQTTSIWVNRLLRNRLSNSEPVLLEVCTDALTIYDSIQQTADLTSKTARVMIEHAAILSERQTNWIPLNKAN